MLIEFLPESSKFLRCENIVRDKIAVSEGNKDVITATQNHTFHCQFFV